MNSPRPRHRDLWMRYIAQCIIGAQPSRYPDIPDKTTGSETEVGSDNRVDFGMEGEPKLGDPSVLNDGPADTHGRQLLNKDLIPGRYPDEEEFIGEIPDDSMKRDEQDTIIEDTHKITAAAEERIRTAVNAYLPSLKNLPPSEAARKILRLCTDDEQYPYDLVTIADGIVNVDKLSNKDRLASIVSEEMLKISNAMIQKWSNPESQQQKLIFSLRRVIARFCNDTQCLSATLFKTDISWASDLVLCSAGGRADIYRLPRSPGPDWAFKTFRLVSNMPPAAVTKERVILLGEAVILSRLRHHNVLDFIGLYEQKRNGIDMLFTISPWMERGEIVDCMNRLVESGMDVPRIRWIHGIACGLQYLHQQCIIHGDLHSGNILVGSDGHACIADYGLAEVAEVTATANITRKAGTGFTWYSAPELTKPGARSDYKSDVWSFGCLCLLIWTNHDPYPETTRTLQLPRQLEDIHRTPEHQSKPMHAFHAAGSPERKQGAILRARVALPCWSREPQARPQMAHVEEILRLRFQEIIAMPIAI